MDQKASAKVLVLDFGAQYGQLIARRVRDLNVYSEIVPCDISADEIREMNASALILSGGPASVYAEDAPSIDPAILRPGPSRPRLLLRPSDHGRDARRQRRPLRGGRVRPRSAHAHGGAAFQGHAHGADRVDEPPRRRVRGARGLYRYRQHRRVPGGRDGVRRSKIFTTQFHPEVKHSEYGQQLLTNFLFKICGLEPTGAWTTWSRP